MTIEKCWNTWLGSQINYSLSKKCYFPLLKFWSLVISYFHSLTESLQADKIEMSKVQTTHSEQKKAFFFLSNTPGNNFWNLLLTLGAPFPTTVCRLPCCIMDSGACLLHCIPSLLHCWSLYLPAAPGVWMPWLTITFLDASSSQCIMPLMHPRLHCEASQAGGKRDSWKKGSLEPTQLLRQLEQWREWQLSRSQRAAI